MITDMDAYIDVIREDAKEVAVEKSADVKESADIQGRQAESQAQIYQIDLEHANKTKEQMDEEDNRALKRLSETQEEKTAKKQKLDEEGKIAVFQAQIYKIDLEHANKVLNMQDEEESQPAELTTITAADVPIPAATTAVALTLNAAPSRRTKGVVIRDPEESTTTSIIIHSKAKSKDKEAELNRTIDWDKVINHVQRKQKEDKSVKIYQILKIIYLKNVAGFKMDYFKGMSYDDIRPVFEKHFDSNVAFLQKTKEQMDEQDNRALKRLNKSKEEKVAKKQKLDEEVKEHKRHLQIVPNEEDDVYTEATPLARKVPVVDYEIYNENNKPYYKIKRADGQWNDSFEVVFMANIYGPQDPSAKRALWSRISNFMHHHTRRYILFGDLNEVREESEQYGSIFSPGEAQVLNSFIHDKGMIDLPMGGRFYTWMNKAGTKMSKFDRFLVSENVLDSYPDLKVIDLEKLWRSILVNGSPSSIFSLYYGLRQGDPLSLFLLKDALHSNLFHGAKVGYSGFCISSFFYADDVVITSDWNHQDRENIVRVLQLFYLVSGLKININKSNVYRIGVPPEEVSIVVKEVMIRRGVTLEDVVPTFVSRKIHGKDCRILDRVSNGEWSWDWNRHDLGGRYADSLNLLLAEIGNANVGTCDDSWHWNLSINGMFTVEVTWKHIDDFILPSMSPSTRWNNSLPQKVNIFVWRLLLDRLPHRVNLSSRGLEISSIVFQVCNNSPWRHPIISFMHVIQLLMFGFKSELGVMLVYRVSTLIWIGLAG
nr:RNA-directed DNA polymerase, eukaryota, reverse transcriptase zinc-binding domain protein [Tanacetum cinerariifolium]